MMVYIMDSYIPKYNAMKGIYSVLAEAERNFEVNATVPTHCRSQERPRVTIATTNAFK